MPFTIERNDLATVEADAIVIAANEHLQITGGVGMTVALAAGFEDLQRACDDIGFCPCGSAVATPGFGLHAKTIVHAVGPVWRGGGDGEIGLLRSAYGSALECAIGEGARSIALPLISAGTYRFPANISLMVAREAIRAFLYDHDDVEIRLVLYSREAVSAGIEALGDIEEYIDDHYVDSHAALGRYASAEAAWQQPVSAPRPNASYPAFGSDLAHAPAKPLEGARDRKNPAGLLSGVAERVREHFSNRDSEVRYDFDEMAALETPEQREEDSSSSIAAMPQATRSLEDLLDSLDAPFSTTLLALIDERGMTDAQVYKRANMSRQHFSKIRSDAAYRPTKKTALALSVALELDLDETRDLLARAGFALSNSSKADVIVEYFIGRGNHDIFEINEALYAFDQPLL